MKKIMLSVVLLLFVLAVPTTVFGQDVDWNGYFEKGDLSAGAGLGIGYGYWGIGLSVFPGAEWTFADIKIAETIPLAFGVSARGLISLSSWYGAVFGVGPFITAHIGFNGLDIPEFLQKIDFYSAIGLAVTFGGNLAYYDVSTLGIASYGGVNYFLKDNLALVLEQMYWSYYSNTTVGVLLKF